MAQTNDNKGPIPPAAGQKPGAPKPNPDDKNNTIAKQIFFWIVAIVILAHLAVRVEMPKDMQLSYSDFYSALTTNTETKVIQSVAQTQTLNYIEVVMNKGDGFKHYTVYIPEKDDELLSLLKTNVQQYTLRPPQTFWIGFFYSMVPTLIFIAFLWFVSYRGMKGMGGGGGGNIFSFGKHKARVTEGDANKLTFANVAGVEEAKEELKEIIDFLKDPKKYEKLGGKIPKGVLLVGSPGCGKTLLAKAVAGEAGVPFYSISGSDFVEMFVGVGASRVRDLFEQAKKSAKELNKGAIIFIDEIDAVGRQRFAGIGGGSDEREQTLNQLLVEMDGFEEHVGIIVMAATNRPDVLDPALLRPGRFDRHVVVDRPDVKGREEILNVHVKHIKLSPDVDLKKIARQTSGFTGADLANLCNEAALLAARRNKEHVEQSEINEAIERVMTGPERKSKVITKKEKRIVAVHESGHALMSILKEDADPLHKVSIIPRGIAALGYTVQVPTDDRYLKSKGELFTKICVLLAGRIAEEQIIGDISTGASNDFQVATDIARRMVTEFGMSSKLGVVAYAKNAGPKFLGRDIGDTDHVSEATARMIDEEIKALIDLAYAETAQALKDGSDKLNLLTTTLIEKEILDAKEVRELLGFPPMPEDDEPKVRVKEVIDANTGSTPTA